MNSRSSNNWGLQVLDNDKKNLVESQSRFLAEYKSEFNKNFAKYKEISAFLSFVVEPEKSVLFISSHNGYLFNSCRPKKSLGIELSNDFVSWAKENYSNLNFLVGNPENLEINDKFDYIVLNNFQNIINTSSCLENLKKFFHNNSKLILISENNYLPFCKNNLNKRQNYFQVNDILNQLALNDFEVISKNKIALIYRQIPFLSSFVNKYISRLPFLNFLNKVDILVANLNQYSYPETTSGVSIIIPCKNEEGNILPAVQRIPKLGSHTEIIFCDDNSSDNTLNEIKNCQKEFTNLDIKIVNGPGISKAKNVWSGFDAASQDILLILDADLTVMPEELPYFISAIIRNKAEFINGVRFSYPMQEKAMKNTNWIGNIIFSYLFSIIFKQKIRDTLCGTKVLWKKDWKRIKPMIGSWGLEDHWGDYELLLGAAKLNLKIIDMPVHYQERVEGVSKMVNVFQNGLRMLTIIINAFFKLRMRF